MNQKIIILKVVNPYLKFNLLIKVYYKNDYKQVSYHIRFWAFRQNEIILLFCSVRVALKPPADDRVPSSIFVK